MIVVVGAGLSGLVVSHHLERLGVPHRVFEASERPGGVVATVRVSGLPLDLGPQRTRRTAAIGELVTRLGLDGEVVEADPSLPLYVYREGRLRKVPFSAGEALGTDLLSLGGKLRVLLEPFSGRLREHESAADFFRRRFGDEAYRALIGPLYGGLYASDPARMRATDALARALEEAGVGGSLLLAFLRFSRRRDALPPGITFREGMATLPRALAAAAGERLRLGTPVRALRPSGGARDTGKSGKSGGPGNTGRWRVETAEGPVDADGVVLALAADRAAALLRESRPEVAERLARLRYNPLAVVHLRSDARLEGLGHQVAFGEALETRGVTWNHSAYGREGLYTAYLGGMWNPELPTRPDEEIAAIATREFEALAGRDAEALHVHRTRVPAWDRTWAALDGLRLPAGLHPCAAWWGRPGIPGRVRAARRLAEELARGGAA